MSCNTSKLKQIIFCLKITCSSVERHGEEDEGPWQGDVKFLPSWAAWFEGLSVPLSPCKKIYKKIITKLIEPFATLLPSHASQEMQPISYTNSLLQCHVTRTAYPGNPPYSLQLLLYLKPTYPLSMRLEVAGYIPGEKDFSTNFANFFHSLHVF